MKYVIQLTKFTQESFDRKGGGGSLQVESEKVYEVDSLTQAAHEMVKYKNHLTSIAVIAVKEGPDLLPRLMKDEERNELKEIEKRARIDKAMTEQRHG